MMNAKEEWMMYLDLYGADFERWPFELTEDQKQEISKCEAYGEALRVDQALDLVEWPALSNNAEDMLMQRVAGLPNPKEQMPVLLMFIQRSSFLMSCFGLFLFLGFALGAQYSGDTSYQPYYDYSPYGVAYDYMVGELTQEGYNE